MLKADAAQEQLKQFQLKGGRPIGLENILARVKKLPAPLKKAAFGLFYYDENGKPISTYHWIKREKIRNALIAPLNDVSKPQLTKLCTTLCGSLSKDVLATWEFLKSTPYQTGYYRKCFRAPNNSEATLGSRVDFLSGIARGFASYQPSVVTPQWLAIWGGYLHDIGHDHIADYLATIIDGGGKNADETFEILCQTVRNEHEIAGLSRMTVATLLKSSRVEGWELVEKTLLAAQRQEGLRQVILESVDEAHPEAFRRMLRIIHDEKLARFSAVVRAVDVWFGLQYESKQLKSVNAVINRSLQFLESSTARTKAIRSDNPEDVHAGLWSLACEDVGKAIKECQKTSRHSNAGVRYVTAEMLANFTLPDASQLLGNMLGDDDLRVAFRALDGSRYDAEELPAKEQKLRFEQFEQLYHRLGPKPKTLPAIVWDWNERKVDRKEVAGYLVSHLGNLPPTRLLDYLSALDPYEKTNVVKMLAKQKKWDTLTRQTLFQLTGSTSADVRESAMDVMSRVKLTSDEIQAIEKLFSRKTVNLRLGALKLLLAQKDAEALASASRMLDSGKSPIRLGGLELLRRLMDDDRVVDESKQTAEAFSERAKKITKEEETQLQAILESPAEKLSLDDALGLMDPAKLSKPTKLSSNKIPVFTKTTVAIVKSLDDLIHQHREKSVSYKRWNKTEVVDMLGTVSQFPYPDWKETPKSQRSRLPLINVWEKWFRVRPKSLRDPDGMELVRAEKYMETVLDYWWEDVLRWAAAKKERKAWLESFTKDQKKTKLRYERLVKSILRWLLFLHRPKNVENFLLDSAESFMSTIPQTLQDELITIAEKGESNHYYNYRNALIDWREQYGTGGFHEIPSYLYKKETNAQFKRRWNLLNFLDKPIDGAPRKRPGIETTLKAYQLGLIGMDDIADALLGPRNTSGYHQSFQELNLLSHHNPSKEVKELLEQLPDVAELVDRAVERVLEVELARGDTQTPATVVATSIQYQGVETLGRILHVIGDKGFKVTNRYSEDARRARLPTLTTMAGQTFPLPEDSQQDFNREINNCIKAGFEKQTVLELMFLAPQWTKFVEQFFNWDGLSEGLYWFLAHMRYINADAESAATSGGYESEETEDSEGNQKHRSAWDRLIAERTHLTNEEREMGAIDVEWFHRVYQQLTPKRWESLAAAARFAANPAQAKRARYLGEVLLGKANRKELFAHVTDKKLKESVRLVGLYPLAQGPRFEKDLAQRYKLLVEYRQYAKGLSSLTKPDAMAALEIGFRNLASTAGFIDPLRLEWAMEADAVKDLQGGSISVSKDEVTVTLELDVVSKPVITTIKKDKPLKSVPPKIKKDKKVAELLARVPEIRKQASRMKESLEHAMCRGDEFEAEELVNLSNHALIKGMLSRLVFIADDRAGYPDQDGTALRDHTGKKYKVKKNSKLRIAHPCDLKELGDWAKWQKECFESSRVQPFKQVFRELYVVTKQERKDGARSNRYAGQQVSPQQARALWGSRNWHTEYDDVFKAFPDDNITANVNFQYGGGTPLEVEGLTFDDVSFVRRDEYKPVPLAKVPARIFSEVMRDIDLVASVAHQGDVDPEASASTVEMRTTLVQETCQLFGHKNVRVKQPRILIKGKLAEYAVHLGSGNVHLMPGGAICIVPVHAQHRGRLFLPFADDDPRTAEIISKVLLLADDGNIQDPSILEQLT